MSPYTLLFFEGVIFMFFGIFTLIILNNIECKDGYSFCNHDTIFDIKSLFTSIQNEPSLLFFFLLYIIVWTVLHIVRIITIKEYSPIYRIVADCIVYFYLFFIELFIEIRKFDLRFCFTFLCYVLLVFSLLVYNEVIIIHVFKLDVNTEIEIKKRSIDDIGMIEELQIEKDKKLLE